MHVENVEIKSKLIHQICIIPIPVARFRGITLHQAFFKCRCNPGSLVKCLELVHRLWGIFRGCLGRVCISVVLAICPKILVTCGHGWPWPRILLSPISWWSIFFGGGGNEPLKVSIVSNLRLCRAWKSPRCPGGRWSLWRLPRLLSVLLRLDQQSDSQRGKNQAGHGLG